MDAGTATLAQQTNPSIAQLGTTAAAVASTAVAEARPASVSFDLGDKAVTSTLAGITHTQAAATMKVSNAAAGRLVPRGAVPMSGPPYEGGCTAWAAGSYIVGRNELVGQRGRPGSTICSRPAQRSTP